MRKLPIAKDTFKVGDHVVYVYSGPERTGVIRYLDQVLASIVDDEIKLGVSIKRRNIKRKIDQ